MSSSWRFHCHVQNLGAFAILNNKDFKKIFGFKILLKSSEKTKTINSLRPALESRGQCMDSKFHLWWEERFFVPFTCKPSCTSISLPQQYYANFKTTPSDQNIPQFLVFQGFFFWFVFVTAKLVHVNRLGSLHQAIMEFVFQGHKQPLDWSW